MDKSSISRTLYLDGVEVAEGSAEVVSAYRDTLRAAFEAFHTARDLATACPPEVKDHWVDLHDATDKKLSKLIGIVGHFAEDYEKRGLESAVTDARWRKELPT